MGISGFPSVSHLQTRVLRVCLGGYLIFWIFFGAPIGLLVCAGAWNGKLELGIGIWDQGIF